MTSKEALKTLYEERAYTYNEKVNHKGDGWKEVIEHYDNIDKCLSVIEKELKVYSSLKEIIKDKIEKLNNEIDEMEKKIEENQYAFADEDFKEEYDYCTTKLDVFDFILDTMKELENDK